MPGRLKSLAALIEDAVKLLTRGKNGKSGAINVTIADEEGTAITINVGQRALALRSERTSRTRLFGELENSILELLKESPRSLRGKEIAAGIGKHYSSHFREVLADLCNRQIILRTTHGYSVHPSTMSSE
jgi:hypothetical protein